MKKHIQVIILMLLMAAPVLQGASPEFKKLLTAIGSAVPKDYIRNRGLSSDNTFYAEITYDQDGFETNQLLFRYDPGSSAFSPRDLALEHNKSIIRERPVLFNDGLKTGKSVIKVILNNKAGVFSITFQSMKNRIMSQPALENLLSKVNLKILEE
jgi:hypothetical protein